VLQQDTVQLVTKVVYSEIEYLVWFFSILKCHCKLN